ncbi:APC family permease [Aeromicrobium phragmitis]|uniref:APC family permease n=2 Tax=Aeromicrobium phragmitis TaxID=2478914 RepID=A0A3L8PS27_9ACTN|nr:APC family permease [Aeromicrobium phragmitis]
MFGAGVFTVFAPAAEAAGSWLLLGLVIAAVVAIANATSSAQLAAEYPESGGTYLYGRERLGEWWGFLAGWSFVIGKTASCAAMALTVAHYTAPESYRTAVAVVAVLAMTAANYCGVTRTAAVARVGVAIVLVALATLTVAAFSSPSAADAGTTAFDPYGVLQAAGLMFFAFAGYARLATMGEEVRDPSRTIPRAIGISLTVALATYGVVALAALHVLGPAGLAAADSPLADVAAASRWNEIAPLVRFGALAGALGALLALMAGIGRTSLAMARRGDLPRWVAAVHPRYRVPHRAELALAGVVIAVVLVADVRGAIGFSSFGVLLYYAVANAAAFTQQHAHRRYPRALQVIGLVGCVTLVATLPVASIGVGVVVLAVGVAYRLLNGRRRASR